MNLRKRQYDEPDVNLTSLIDVVLLLLIFFMVSTTFVEEGRIKLLLPQASDRPAEQQPQKTPIEVTVTAGGEYRVNGQTLINTSQATLAAAVSKLAGDTRDVPVTIRADARATHQSVVTAMDVLGRLGFRMISIATVNDQHGTSTAR